MSDPIMAAAFAYMNAGVRRAVTGSDAETLAAASVLRQAIESQAAQVVVLQRDNDELRAQVNTLKAELERLQWLLTRGKNNLHT